MESGAIKHDTKNGRFSEIAMVSKSFLKCKSSIQIKLDSFVPVGKIIS